MLVTRLSSCLALTMAVVTLLLPDRAAAQDIGDVAPDEIARAKPGGIIRIWPLEGGAENYNNAKAYRVVYRSTGLSDEPIAVTGAIIFPDGPPPAGGRHIVAWAHPTTGIDRRCAPTLLPGVQIQGIGEMLRRGYVIAATDYPGLGSPGVHPYLIGVSEARSILDSVRAARELPDAHARDTFAVWGHSQGGQAALFTGQLAASYAPELKLAGIAAAAPATYLAELFEADRRSGAGLTAMAILSWSKLFHLSIEDVVEPDAMQSYLRTANDCIETIDEFVQETQDAAPLARDFLKGDPTKLLAWRAIMDKNTPGQAPAGGPVFLSQGSADTTVRPAITHQYADHLCEGGARVKLVIFDGVSHAFIARDSAVTAIDWIAGRFAGAPAPSDCE